MTDLSTTSSQAATDPGAIGAPCGASDHTELKIALRNRIAELGDMPIPVEDGEYCLLLAMAGMAPTSEAAEREVDAPILEAFLRLHSAKRALLDHIDAQTRALEEAKAALEPFAAISKRKANLYLRPDDPIVRCAARLVSEKSHAA